MTWRVLIAWACFCQSVFLCGDGQDGPRLVVDREGGKRARVVVVRDAQAVQSFNPRAEPVARMVERGLLRLTAESTLEAAWRSLVNTQDVIGIKVVSTPGRMTGTRIEVVEAVIKGLLAAGVAAPNLVIWDKHLGDLRTAGFFALADRHGVRVASTVAAGYDERNAPYETALLGPLIFSDREFGQKGDGVGRRSYVSKLVTQQLMKIINIPPLLNHYQAGVSGALWSVTMSSVDNTLRFEADRGRLAEAIPDIYALPAFENRIVLHIMDALIAQYEGSDRGLLHYSATLNQLWFSRDPVALDVLALEELQRQRPEKKSITNYFDLYANASLLDLGVSDRARIDIEEVR